MKTVITVLASIGTARRIVKCTGRTLKAAWHVGNYPKDAAGITNLQSLVGTVTPSQVDALADGVDDYHQRLLNLAFTACDLFVLASPVPVEAEEVMKDVYPAIQLAAEEAHRAWRAIATDMRENNLGYWSASLKQICPVQVQLTVAAT